MTNPKAPEGKPILHLYNTQSIVPERVDIHLLKRAGGATPGQRGPSYTLLVYVGEDTLPNRMRSSDIALITAALQSGIDSGMQHGRRMYLHLFDDVEMKPFTEVQVLGKGHDRSVVVPKPSTEVKRHKVEQDMERRNLGAGEQLVTDNPSPPNPANPYVGEQANALLAALLAISATPEWGEGSDRLNDLLVAADDYIQKIPTGVFGKQSTKLWIETADAGRLAITIEQARANGYVSYRVGSPSGEWVALDLPRLAELIGRAVLLQMRRGAVLLAADGDARYLDEEYPFTERNVS